MVDPLDIEGVREQIPVGRFIGNDLCVRFDTRPGESHTTAFLKKHTGQRSAVALAQRDDATAFRPPVGAEPPIDAVRAGVGRSYSRNARLI
jgi:hypothetical protein